MRLTVFNTSNTITNDKPNKKFQSRRDPGKVNQPVPNQPENSTVETAETIKSLLHYPSLERVFDPTDARRLPALKQKMRSTIDDLERVVRRGSKDDAERAARAVEAFKVTLDFLDELETARQTQSK